MKKIARPVCGSCGTTAEYESEDRPTLRLCYRCVYQAATWMVKNQFADGNPLLMELADGVFQRIDGKAGAYIQVWWAREISVAAEYRLVIEM